MGFSNFFIISNIRHQIELLPGMGKKHTLAILDEREKKNFDSFEEIMTRVKGCPDPFKSIVKRILEELEDSDLKHYLFIRRKKPRDRGRKPSYHSNRR